jgi:hypothetical protein
MISGCSWPKERTPRIANLWILAILAVLEARQVRNEAGEIQLNRCVSEDQFQRVVTRR